MEYLTKWESLTYCPNTHYLHINTYPILNYFQCLKDGLSHLCAYIYNLLSLEHPSPLSSPGLHTSFLKSLKRSYVFVCFFYHILYMCPFIEHPWSHEAWVAMTNIVSLYHNYLLTCFHSQLAWEVPRFLSESLASIMVLTTLICDQFILFQENKKKIHLKELVYIHHGRNDTFWGWWETDPQLFLLNIRTYS